MTDEDDRRLKELALRAERGELTLPSGTARARSGSRAETHAHLFATIGALPEGAVHSLFGASVQRALYVYYEEGAGAVGVVLDPPAAVHGPSAAALEERVRAHVVARRGVMAEDVHVFGKQVPRDLAAKLLQSLVDHT